VARLRHLATHLRSAVRAALPRARFYTGDDAAMGGWITTIELPGVDPESVQRRLLERDRILVQPMVGDPRSPEIRGLRVTPNVYTSPAELDRFVAALKAMAGA
jgi:selenocysteine lyase/cysteine desulfurase